MTDLMKLFYSFFKIGIVGFGGGYAMVSMIMTECGKNFGLSMDRFADLLAVDLIIPGPIGANAATYVGFITSGFWGALVATIAISLPSYLIVLTTMYFMDKFKSSVLLNGFFRGVKPASIGLICAAAIIMGKEVLLNQNMKWENLFANPIGTVSIGCLLIFLGCLVCEVKFKVNPILLTVLAGIIGAVFVF